jgi:hypothetical protein
MKTSRISTVSLPNLDPNPDRFWTLEAKRLDLAWWVPGQKIGLENQKLGPIRTGLDTTPVPPDSFEIVRNSVNRNPEFFIFRDQTSVGRSFIWPSLFLLLNDRYRGSLEDPLLQFLPIQ